MTEFPSRLRSCFLLAVSVRTTHQAIRCIRAVCLSIIASSFLEKDKVGVEWSGGSGGLAG